MSIRNQKIGIVGGSGMLGRAISRALLSNALVEDSDLWISNRSGDRKGFEDWPKTHITNDSQQLKEACDVLVLCVPPDQFKTLSLQCEGKLIISVMAGITLEQLQSGTRSTRIVRAMSSPAAELMLAYSPWVASEDVTADDRETINQLLNACGESDELHVESHIDLFTAMTGPIPGFVALFANCVSRFAIDNGVSEIIANRAVKQLFLAAGTVMASSSTTPGDDVKAMINYNGTTAAGLRNMQASSLAQNISQGLQAAVEKTRHMS